MVLPLLLVGHFLGDWVVQTDKQALDKPTSWRAMAGHVLGYHVTMALVLALGFTRGLTVTEYLVILVVSAVSHAFIDRRWPVRKLLAMTGSKNFSEVQWGVIAADQALHLSILSLLAWWAA